MLSRSWMEKPTGMLILDISQKPCMEGKYYILSLEMVG